MGTIATIGKTTIIGKVTGAVYIIFYHQEAKVWTYSDERGYGPSLGWSSNHHKSAEEVIQRVQEVVDPVEASKGDVLDRLGYESACQSLGLTPMSDKDIDGYGVRYGEFSMSSCDVPTIQAMTLAKRRLFHIEEEAAKVPRRTLQQPVKAAWGSQGVRYDEGCNDCGDVSVVDNDSSCCKRCH